MRPRTMEEMKGKKKHDRLSRVGMYQFLRSDDTRELTFREQK